MIINPAARIRRLRAPQGREGSRRTPARAQLRGRRPPGGAAQRGRRGRGGPVLTLSLPGPVHTDRIGLDAVRGDLMQHSTGWRALMGPDESCTDSRSPEGENSKVGSVTPIRARLEGAGWVESYWSVRKRGYESGAKYRADSHHLSLFSVHHRADSDEERALEPLPPNAAGARLAMTRGLRLRIATVQRPQVEPSRRSSEDER